jgi:hypothetical protein
MQTPFKTILGLLLLLVAFHARCADMAEKVIDVPTRPGVSVRMLVLSPPNPKAAVLLIPGGHGGLQISPNGSLQWGAGNFLVRSRQMFAEQGLLVAVADAPSDRQAKPFLNGFRFSAEHGADIKALIGWMRSQAHVPVWLVGTSRGTLSAAYATTALQGADGPDGLVLTSSIVGDYKEGSSVIALPLDKIHVPTLVVHHEQDGCSVCAYREVPTLMNKLIGAPRKELLSVQGGENKGDPCEAFAHHGFNGIESKVVKQLASWVLVK